MGRRRVEPAAPFRRVAGPDRWIRLRNLTLEQRSEALPSTLGVLANFCIYGVARVVAFVEAKLVLVEFKAERGHLLYSQRALRWH